MCLKGLLQGISVDAERSRAPYDETVSNWVLWCHVCLCVTVPLGSSSHWSAKQWSAWLCKCTASTNGPDRFSFQNWLLKQAYQEFYTRETSTSSSLNVYRYRVLEVKICGAKKAKVSFTWLLSGNGSLCANICCSYIDFLVYEEMCLPHLPVACFSLLLAGKCSLKQWTNLMGLLI